MSDTVIEIVVPASPEVIEVQIPGEQGANGRGITVSETPPENPQLNDLWVDIS